MSSRSGTAAPRTGAARRRVGPVIGRVAAALALVAAVLCGGLALGTGPAVAAARPISACTTTSGVVLAVDFSHWGGPLLRSCGSTPTTGYQLLNQGGWATTGTQHDGPAFICRIGYGGYQGGTQYPTSKNEACVLTPPATAYWSYWHADAGRNTWSYSQLGAMSYHPEPGSVDLWIFGATNVAGTQGKPTISPDSVRAHNTTPGSGSSSAPPRRHAPATHSAPSTPPRTHAPAPHARPSSAAPTAPATTPAATTAGTPTAPGTPSTAAAPPSGPPPSTPPQPQPQDAEPTAAAHHSAGSALPFVITAAVVAVIGALIALRVRQRRREEQ